MRGDDEVCWVGWGSGRGRRDMKRTRCLLEPSSIVSTWLEWACTAFLILWCKLSGCGGSPGDLKASQEDEWWRYRLNDELSSLMMTECMQVLLLGGVFMLLVLHFDLLRVQTTRYKTVSCTQQTLHTQPFAATPLDSRRASRGICGHPEAKQTSRAPSIPLEEPKNT